MVSLKLDGEPFIIMNTHLQANYLADWRPSNSQTKIQLDQVSYLAELAHGQPGDAWVVICGDFNFPRQAPAYKHMVLQSGLIDALVDDPRPTYQPFPLVSAKWQTCLDYIFYRRPVKVTSIISADIVPIVNNSARWSFQRFLTDHHALTLTVH